MIEQGIDQCAGPVSGCRVNRHAGGLIDHDQIIILKQDIKRNILRLWIGGLGVGFGQDILATGHDFGFRIGQDGPIELKRSSFDQSLATRARERFKST